MKKILLLASAFVFTLAASAQAKPEDQIKVNVETHDFGKVKQNVPVTYYFEIKNISDKPVVVENTWASCGCTTPEKIVEPIAPGATVKLKVDYNAAAVGPINKDVFIKLAGIDQAKSVKITGEVLTAEAYEAYLKEKGKGGSIEKAPGKN
jgi:isochorismate hydrolase